MAKKIDIQLAPTDLCTGCSACVSICKHNALSMVTDGLGFLNPKWDVQQCTRCHICEKVCPVISSTKKEKITACAYNAQTKDRLALAKCSSGGAFYELSRYVINKGGVVFGVKFNGIHVEHSYAETLEGIELFMGSKYIQSEIGDTFQKAKSFLKEGRWVLFSGTPCQIAGLKHFLDRDYKNLLTVDLICHGVPSPGLWEKYISRLKKKLEATDVKDIRFRRKGKEGNPCTNFFFGLSYLKEKQWHVYEESRADNLFFAYFTRHLFRSSCYECPYRDIYTPEADITIGDAITNSQYSEQNEMPSTVIVRSTLGREVVESIKTNFRVFEPLDIDAVNAYYQNEKTNTDYERDIRPWRLSNLIGMRLPLDYCKWVWKHDKFHIVIKRKIKKLCRRNIK